MNKKDFWDKYHFVRAHIMISDNLPCKFCNKKNIDEWIYIRGVKQRGFNYEYEDERMCKDCFLGNVFIENKELMNTDPEYIKKICDNAYEEDKEAIDDAIKYLGDK